MNKNKTILLTFDYELFLGSKSGTVANCLIKPTNELLTILEKHNLKNAVFFVDTTYLIRLSQENSSACKKDFETVAKQIQQIAEKGHYVFPHIHPHWIDAIYHEETNQWSLNDFSKYRFHNTPNNLRGELFDRSITLLTDILKNSNHKHALNAYRAGGWSLQPFSDFEPYFKKHGIVYDFSVIKGFKNLSQAQYFDFTNCPDKEVYRFENDPCIEARSGTYTEFVISSVKINATDYWLGKIWGKYLWKRGIRSMGDGSGLVIKDTNVVKKKNEFLGSANREMISIELLTYARMPKYKAFLTKNDYMHFISHPKMLSSHNLKTFDKFIEHAINKFDIETDFLKITL